MMNGIIKTMFSHRRMLIFVSACMMALVSCNQKETYTEVYYIRNDLDRSIILDFHRQLFYDTCSVPSTDPLQRVCFESEAEIPSGGTIRLHPICRRELRPNDRRAYPLGCLASLVTLIDGNDTIFWRPDERLTYPGAIFCMFSSDSIYSPFNNLCWHAVEDANIPNTFYYTFPITQEDIERSKQ